MSACPAQTFTNIPPALWARITTLAQNNGITLNGNSGQIIKDGFTGTWNYDSAFSGAVNLQTAKTRCISNLQRDIERS